MLMLRNIRPSKIKCSSWRIGDDQAERNLSLRKREEIQGLLPSEGEGEAELRQVSAEAGSISVQAGVGQEVQDEISRVCILPGGKEERFL